MTVLFDPFRELDRIAAGVLDASQGPRLMPIDLFRDGDTYVLNADLPGIDPGSIDVDIDGRVLTIRAERTARSRDGVKWMASERPHGSFYRQFTMSDALAVESISANYDNGVLSVTIPVSERAKPRKIEVQSAEKTLNVEASAQPAEPAAAVAS